MHVDIFPPTYQRDVRAMSASGHILYSVMLLDFVSLRYILEKLTALKKKKNSKEADMAKA